MPEVLNEWLYRRLKRLYRSVKVANQGEQFIADEYHDVLEDGLRLNIEQEGEYYRICCPFCSDTRHRLYISYQFGRQSKFKRPLTFLAVCFNETNCMDDPANRRMLLSDVEEIDGVLEQAVLRPGKVYGPGEKRVFLPPGPVTPLADLPYGHEARYYLEARGFDCRRLSDYYKVGYCTASLYYLARERIYCPFYDKGELRGWQCRFVGELDWSGPGRGDRPPKYFSCPGMQRKDLLGNFDNAKHFHTGVLVEGPFDAYRFGPMCCVTFGAYLSPVQFARFTMHFRKTAGVLLWDPSLYDDRRTAANVEKLIRRMASAMDGNFAVVKLPRGTDPGSLDRSVSRPYVEAEARKQGVKVSWRRRD